MRLEIAYGRSRDGTVGELVDSAREHGTARYVVPPESENNLWTLVHLGNLGDLYGRLLEGEASDGTLLLAASDGPHRAWEIAEAASRVGGVDGRIEASRWTRRWRSWLTTPTPSRWISGSPARGRGGSWAGRPRLLGIRGA